jgi:hypothetical protein
VCLGIYWPAWLWQISVGDLIDDVLMRARMHERASGTHSACEIKAECAIEFRAHVCVLYCDDG